MTGLGYWLLAARPKTLGIALTPVVVGGAIAYHGLGHLDWPVWLACLTAAAAIQIGTNLHNDAADFERGTDTPERLGPKRACAEGWLPAAAVRRAAHLSFATAFALGLYLVGIGSWPILALGLASIGAGYAYTGGPRPIGYRPLGEVFVLGFFGIGAVGGTYYLQTLNLAWPAIVAGIAVGLPAAAVLLINNYRDLNTDRRAGRQTLATVIGRGQSRLLYAAMLLSPPALATLSLPDGSPNWLPWLALPMAGLLIRQLYRLPVSPKLNALLAATAGYQLLFGLLYAGAWIA